MEPTEYSICLDMYMFLCYIVVEEYIEQSKWDFFFFFIFIIFLFIYFFIIFFYF